MHSGRSRRNLFVTRIRPYHYSCQADLPWCHQQLIKLQQNIHGYESLEKGGDVLKMTLKKRKKKKKLIAVKAVGLDPFEIQHT